MRFLYLATLLMFAARAAFAQTTLDLARAALLRGDIAATEQLLGEVDAATADPNDFDFLKGTLALERRDYREAVARFKAVLARNASLNRVRLDLARAYFLAGEDTAAERTFRQAMAQGVPSEVQANIDRYLDALRRRKRWNVSMQASLVPDSNINAATAAETVTLFGLPFQLDPGARAKSGLGVSGALSGDYQWDIAADTKLRAGAALYDVEYGDSAFADRSFNLSFGPRWLAGQGREVSVLAAYGRRWLGGRGFSVTAGGRIEGQMQLTPRLILGGTLFGQSVSYAAAYGPYSGPVFGGNATVTYAFDARSFLRGTAGVTREQADQPPLRDTQYSLGIGYYRADLPGRFAAFAEIRATYAPYDALLPVFARTRRDREIDYRLSLSNQHVEILGFTPVVTYLHTDRVSNVTLYGYARDRVEAGFTRLF